MKKRIAKALRILTGVVVGSVIFVAGTWMLSKALANNRPSRFHGHKLDYWLVQVVANDVTASNQANAILNQEIIPQLTDRMFHDTNDSKFLLTVIGALEYAPWITYIEYNQAPGRRAMAARNLGGFGPAGKAAIPALMQAVQNSDSAVHEAAITSLGKIHSQPDVVIPFLIKYLSDDDLDDEAATALGEYGRLARPAVPKIIPLLHGDDDDAQVAARDALLKIDPVALTNATKIQAEK
jgi:HEAT repeat protein